MRVSQLLKMGYRIHGCVLVQEWHCKGGCLDWENHLGGGKFLVLQNSLKGRSLRLFLNFIFRHFAIEKLLELWISYSVKICNPDPGDSNTWLSCDLFSDKFIRFMFKGDLWTMKLVWRVGSMEKTENNVEWSSLLYSIMLGKEADGKVFIQRAAFGWLFLGFSCGIFCFLMSPMSFAPDFRLVFEVATLSLSMSTHMHISLYAHGFLCLTMF